MTLGWNPATDSTEHNRMVYMVCHMILLPCTPLLICNIARVWKYITLQCGWAPAAPPHWGRETPAIWLLKGELVTYNVSKKLERKTPVIRLELVPRAMRLLLIYRLLWGVAQQDYRYLTPTNTRHWQRHSSLSQPMELGCQSNQTVHIPCICIRANLLIMAFICPATMGT